MTRPEDKPDTHIVTLEHGEYIISAAKVRDLVTFEVPQKLDGGES